jgi:ubiquinone/menaquinone biosynthesis C-methylase UbiE
VTFGQRFARLTTDAVVRWPWLWPFFRRLTARQFDAIAPQWDGFRTGDSFAPFEAALAAVEGEVKDALDVGTGTGEGAVRVATRFPAATVIGVDVANEMLAHARRKAPELRFQQADAAELPFDDGSFDLVTHANMIPFFDEVARVLRPGGIAFFAFSAGDETPIYVPSERLRAELERRGFIDFANFTAARGTAFSARKR